MKYDKQELSVKIGTRLRDLRLDKKMTIEKVALLADMEYTQLSRIELGIINTSLFQIYKLSKILEINMSDIFTDIKK